MIFFEVIYVFDNIPVTNNRVSDLDGANLGPTAYEPMGPKMAFLARKLYKMAFQMHSCISIKGFVHPSICPSIGLFFLNKDNLEYKTSEYDYLVYY